ncbi:selenium metabolism-associated LysR family transcriptional regulator [Deferrisoma camini]|uniref:selenium metabolism-associated LysR family transcriptional regulator n=1 Tax=Deferrisoma camini TaxID=1035120 RepID=UPI00046CC98D|nr:selenium metabolism-associated LysR family transcriptional regulator [Deferrisoma camini]
MTFRHLEAFVAVAGEGGFTRAAEVLCLTQPTVSGQIRELEEELGVTLFHRLPRAVELTEAGRRFLVRAREVLAGRDRLLEEAAAYRGVVDGTLEIHASTIPGEYLLPPVLARFKAEHPRVRVVLRVADTGEVLRRVESGEVGLGVVGRPAGTDLECRPLWRDRVVCVVPAGWEVADRLEPPDLERLPLVVREEGSGTRTTVEEALGERWCRMRVVAELGSTAAVLEAVKAGLGAGFVSERAAREAAEAGKVRFVAVEGVLPVERRFHAVWHPRRVLSPAARALLELLSGDGG